jgi:hypothetical protein
LPDLQLIVGIRASLIHGLRAAARSSSRVVNLVTSRI